MIPDIDPQVSEADASIFGEGGASVAITQLVTEILASGRPLQFRVHGVSMRPFIQDGDLLEIHTLHERQIRIGDILLINFGGCYLVSHRVVRIRSNASQKRFLLQGDAVLQQDGWITFDQILGRAVRIQRNRKRHNLNNPLNHVSALLFVVGLTTVKSVYAWLRPGL